MEFWGFSILHEERFLLQNVNGGELKQKLELHGSADWNKDVSEANSQFEFGVGAKEAIFVTQQKITSQEKDGSAM